MGDFVWGVATSAYQIEGAVTADGRGASIWDIFSHTPGRTVANETGDEACDHYHRYLTDLDLMAELGVDAYRFSVAWPRIQPTGAGAVAPGGVDFYRRLAAGLRERAITPFVTLYHWDLPQALEDLGGWRSRDTALRFAEYAAIVANALQEFEPVIITLNEPYCSSIVGYAEGRHAPGAREGHGALAAAHHLLVGHGLAVAAVRSVDPKAPVGVTLNLSPVVPASSHEADLAAARRQDLLVNRLFTAPLLGGTYPEDAEAVWGDLTDFSFRRDDDLATIGVPVDFLGVNYYYRLHVGADGAAVAAESGRGAAVAAESGRGAVPDRPRTASEVGARSVGTVLGDTTSLGWPVEPEGLYATLTGLREHYPALPPIYVTENGCAYPDLIDPQRIAFIDAHLDQLRRARADGVDVRGYFYWSLLDNFEWARGYAPRFGLVQVDYATQTRTRRPSFDWFRQRIRSGL
jgi:beta-glucosidase